METFRYSIGTWAFGAVPDRYMAHGYRDRPSLESQIESASKVPGCSGVELPFAPGAVTPETSGGFARFTADRGLAVSALAVNVTGDRRWAQGSITNPRKELRDEAIVRIADCLACAKAMNVGLVNLWMGQDGFDYPFEADYARLWEDLVAGLKESAAAVPEVCLSVEYKAKEPRVRNVPNSASQTLLAVMAAGAPNLRVTLDFGHAILGGENPSQSAALLASYGKLGHIHLNDNLGDWDWDMAAGVSHWWELVEFCLWLDRSSYRGWLSLDIFPHRVDPAAACALCIKATEKARTIAGNLKLRGVDESLARRDAMSVYSAIMDM